LKRFPINILFLYLGIGNIYTRAPDTPLSDSFVNHLYDIYFQNGIYDVLPLHEIKHDDCAQRKTDEKSSQYRRFNDYGNKNIYND
jgi:hypothetical protein